MGKRNLEACRKQNAGILFTYHFLLNFIKKGYPLFKHRNILACVDVYNSYETSWL